MYYNQNDYPNTPYPAPGYPSATVKSGGCGPSSAAMLIEDLVGIAFPPDKMAEYARACGARVSGGTDMAKLCRKLADYYGLKLTTTNQAPDVLIALERGARVIAHVGGDRAGYTGLFSDGGHFIYLRAKNGTQVTVWDPGDRIYPTDKYKINGRASRVTVKRPDIYAEMVEIDKDCQNRSPRYYILEDAMTKDDVRAIVAEVLADMGKLPPADWDKNGEYQRAIDRGITDGTRPQGLATRQEAAIMIQRATEA